MTAKFSEETLPPPRYELLRQLGEGGVGTVYVALDRETDEHIALKQLTGMNPVSVLRFKREFRAVANIRHHNLVKLYELQHADDGWFLTMELVEGVELFRGLGVAGGVGTEHAIDDSRAPGHDARKRIARVVAAFSQLAQGICAIHQASMLHRDLKPSNVMLEHSGRVVVLDFGLVRPLGDSSHQVTMQGTTAGTPAYMPPEQACGEPLSEASDWYAFGVMLYEALSGVLPIHGRTPLELIHRKLRDDAPSLPQQAGPRALRELCAQLLRRDPRERPGPQAILDVLAGHATERAHTAEHTSILPEPLTSQLNAPLVGRATERQRLEAALANCIREHAMVAVHVRGPSGSGKTTLVQSFLSDSLPLSATTSAEPLALRSRCYEREAMPFKSIDGVVDALVKHLLSLDDLQAAHHLPQDVAALSALFPAFERVPAVQQLMAATKRTAQGDALHLRRRAEQGFRYLLRSIASVRPLVIWIDDLQWGDLDSTQVLEHWLKRPADAPMLLVLSYRSDEVATSTCLSTLMGPAAKSTQLTQQYELDLLPLKDSDVQALCWERIGHTGSLAPAVIARIASAAHGNPFLVTQLAALARAKLARGELDLTALSVGDLVQHMSAMLSEPAQQLLRVLAVAGRPLAPRVALFAAAIVRERRAHIHELQTLRLVRTRYIGDEALLEVYHDSVRESVYASLSEPERTRTYARLLDVLAQEDRADAAWLHELALGAGERGRARYYGVLAAESASANLAFERAAELYERCVHLTAAEPDVARLWKELALAHVRCRRGTQAAGAYLKASELASGAERVALLQQAASHLLRTGRFEDGERLVQQVLGHMNIRVPESQAGLYAAIGWERARIAVLERLVKPRDGVVIPQDERQLGMLYAMLALDTQGHAPLRAALFQVRATRICFQYGEARTTARAYCMNAALSALTADGAAAKRVDEMLARAEALTPSDDSEATVELNSARTLCAMLLGRLSQVIEPARVALELSAARQGSGERGDYFYRLVARTAWISALQFLGRHHEAAEEVRALLEEADAANNRFAALQAALVRTGFEQAESGCRESRARLDLERDELPKGTTSVLHMVHVVSVMRAACATGEHDWALQVWSDFKPRYEASPLQHSMYLVYLLHVNHARLLLNHHVATGSAEDPERLIREQLSWLARKAPLPFRKPAPLRLLGRLAAMRGERAQAAELLESSRRAHAEIGAVDEAERDSYALGALRGGAEGAQQTASALEALRSMGIQDSEADIRAYYPELARGQ